MTNLLRRSLIALALMAGIAPAAGQVPNFPLTMPSDTFVGRIQPGSGPSSALPIASLLARVISPNSIPNSILAKASPVTLKGNPTAGTANVQDFTIQGLVNRNAPDANNDKLLIFDSAAGTFKYVLPGAIAAAATSGVSSISGMTGGLACADVINCAGGTISSKFTQTGTGAVSVLLGSYLQTVVTPEQFGALCNGTGDDGPAIQRAIDSNAGNVRVELSPCVYRVVTAVTINKKGVSIAGAGRNVTVIDYEPGAAGTLFTIGDGITRLFGTKLRDFSIISADTTHLKVGWKFIDVSDAMLYNVSCSRTNLFGGSWIGGGGSTCLQTNGRDTSVFEKLSFSAEQPIVLNLDPAIYISTDHFIFRDMTLVGSGFPCITANDGIVMTNTTFDGFQSWNLCTAGFFANDTTSTQNWNNVAFRNVRAEQTQSAGAGFSIYISVATGNRLIGLTLDNVTMDAGMRGVYLRNVQNATIQNSIFYCGVSPVALDINDTDDYLRLLNTHFESACTLTNSSGSPMVLQWAASNPSTASSTIPADAVFGAAQVVSPTFMNAIGLPKIAGTGVAPGAGKGRIEMVPGTNAGTCKFIAYAGTSGASFTLLDNIGGGC